MTQTDMLKMKPTLTSIAQGGGRRTGGEEQRGGAGEVNGGGEVTVWYNLKMFLTPVLIQCLGSVVITKLFLLLTHCSKNPFNLHYESLWLIPFTCLKMENHFQSKHNTEKNEIANQTFAISAFLYYRHIKC